MAPGTGVLHRRSRRWLVPVPVPGQRRVRLREPSGAPFPCIARAAVQQRSTGGELWAAANDRCTVGTATRAAVELGSDRRSSASEEPWWRQASVSAHRVMEGRSVYRPPPTGERAWRLPLTGLWTGSIGVSAERDRRSQVKGTANTGANAVGVLGESTSGLASRFGSARPERSPRIHRRTAQQATIAYAFVNGSGSPSATASTPNLSSTYDTVNKRYVITIAARTTTEQRRGSDHHRQHSLLATTQSGSSCWSRSSPSAACRRSPRSASSCSAQGGVKGSGGTCSPVLPSAPVARTDAARARRARPASTSESADPARPPRLDRGDERSSAPEDGPLSWRTVDTIPPCARPLRCGAGARACPGPDVRARTGGTGRGRERGSAPDSCPLAAAASST